MPPCLSTRPVYLAGTWIHDAYFSVFAKKDGENQYKWFYPLFLSCPQRVSGTVAKTVMLTFKNGERRSFWYYEAGEPDQTTASNGSTTAPQPIPSLLVKPCIMHKTLSSSELLEKMKKRHAFQTAHSNVYARKPMGYTDCFNTYNFSRTMCIEE